MEKENTPAKKPGLSLSLGSLKSFSRIFTTHSTLIILLITLGLLIVSLLRVQTILTTSDDSAYHSEKSANRVTTGFDTATIEKINNLNDSNSQSAITLPEGRRNPFVE